MGADHDGSSVFAAAFVALVVGLVVFRAAARVRGVPVSVLSPTTLRPFVLAGVLYPALFRLLCYTGVDRIGANVTGAVVAANPAVAALLVVLLQSGDARRQVGVVSGHRAGLAFFVAAGAVVAGIVAIVVGASLVQAF